MIPSLEPAFGAFLNAASTLQPLIPLDEAGVIAIYPVRTPQDAALADPYVIWRFKNYSEHMEVGDATPQEIGIGGPPVVAEQYCEIVVYSKDYGTAQTVAATIMALLRFNAPITGGPKIIGSWIIDKRDGELAPTGMFTVVVDVRFQVNLTIQG